MIFKHLLLPTDGSPLSDKGVRRGIAFAKQIKARVTALHVVPEFRALADETLFPTSIDVRQRFIEEARARGQRIVDKVAKQAKASRVRCKVIVHPGGLPHEQIIATARKEKCDLIFMASHGRRGLPASCSAPKRRKYLPIARYPCSWCAESAWRSAGRRVEDVAAGQAATLRLLRLALRGKRAPRKNNTERNHGIRSQS